MFDAVTLRPQCGHRGSISRGCPVPAPQIDDQDPRRQQRHADADRFDVLSERVAACEDSRRRIEAWLEFGGMERSRLDDLSGSRSRASEIMHKRPALSLAMIGKLHEDPAIPAEGLIQPYHLETGKLDARRRQAAEMTSSDLISEAAPLTVPRKCVIQHSVTGFLPLPAHCCY